MFFFSYSRCEVPLICRMFVFRTVWSFNHSSFWFSFFFFNFRPQQNQCSQRAFGFKIHQKYFSAANEMKNFSTQIQTREAIKKEKERLWPLNEKSPEFAHRFFSFPSYSVVVDDFSSTFYLFYTRGRSPEQTLKWNDFDRFRSTFSKSKMVKNWIILYSI